MADHLPIDRAGLRRRLRAIRRSIPPAVQHTRAHAAAAHALALVDTLDLVRGDRPLVMASTMADDGELDPAPLVDALQERGARVAFARVADDVMTFVDTDPSDTFVIGPGGVRQPAVASVVLAPDDLDLVLVPVVAFDRRCERLGRGGGHYDRAFAGRDGPPPVLVGLAHDEQLVADLVPAPHDVALDHIVTPTTVHSRPAD